MVSVQGIGRDSKLGFLRFGFGSRNSDRTGTKTRPNSSVFLSKYQNYSKKLNYLVSVRGIGRDSELHFLRFGFWSRNSDQTETKPRPRSSVFSRNKFGSIYLQTLSRILLIKTSLFPEIATKNSLSNQSVEISLGNIFLIWIIAITIANGSFKYTVDNVKDDNGSHIL